MKRDKIIYYIATGVLSAIILFSASMYIFNHDAITVAFTTLGYPTYLIYPYAAAKIVGIIVLWNTKYMILKEWAYSAFFFAIILAFFAHIMIGDGGQSGAILAFIALTVSYIFKRRIQG
ncbi:DoxX family protein [Crocinitomix catalasitica]|uniref:DoxX family protein n=1 Tax=Crocinitomix catalasitica TaxID=184607 RepID=UPI00048116EC|nr:DoxX family protein [Crocinitomix catalasitica]